MEQFSTMGVLLRVSASTTWVPVTSASASFAQGHKFAALDSGAMDLRFESCHVKMTSSRNTELLKLLWQRRA
jgi:hypothetical protein